MLSLTKRTDYALIGLGYLAQNPGRVVSAREIAEAFEMPQSLVMNIMKRLNHSRWVHSTRGTRGGYRLRVDLSDHTVFDLIEILEGPVSLTRCMIHEGQHCGDSRCRVRKSCPIQAPIKALQHKLVEFLKETRLSAVLASGKSAEPAREAAGAR